MAGKRPLKSLSKRQRRPVLTAALIPPGTVLKKTILKKTILKKTGLKTTILKNPKAASLPGPWMLTPPRGSLNSSPQPGIPQPRKAPD
ncbi:MAG: hypothetical protein LBO82_05225 [Synergistaceae bacterium]|nr:hypothetical protein [Synergistaceae bacterium]